MVMQLQRIATITWVTKPASHLGIGPTLPNLIGGLQMNNYKLELSHYDAVRLHYLLEVAAGVHGTPVDEEEFQSEISHFGSILEDYISRRREMLQEARQDWW